MEGLSGRVVVVTGAGSGIGAAIVSRLRREGSVPVAWDLRAPEEPAGGSSAAVDVTDPGRVAAAVSEAVARHGAVHGLVNCAGVLGDTGHRLADQAVEGARRTFAVNAEAVLLTCRQVLPLMVDQGGGAIVNVASNAALRGRPGLAPYAASKAAAISYTKTAAREYGRYGVRVNAVCPGGTRTPMLGPEQEQAAEAMIRTIPLRRFAEPEEIAGVVVFLLSSDASYLTGEAVVVDGGDTC